MLASALLAAEDATTTKAAKENQCGDGNQTRESLALSPTPRSTLLPHEVILAPLPAGIRQNNVRSSAWREVRNSRIQEYLVAES